MVWGKQLDYAQENAGWIIAEVPSALKFYDSRTAGQETHQDPAQREGD